MTNPFVGRALGARAAGPQFPQRRSIARKKGGRVPGFFLGGLFGGGGGGSSETHSNSTSDFHVTDPDYNALKGSVLGRGLTLSEKPYEQYTGQGVVPMSADQLAAAGNVRGNQGNYQPFYNQAGSTVGRINNLDPASAGLPYVNQAAGMQTGTQAASPFVAQASKTLPGSIDSYMSPYTDRVIGGIQDASNRNFEQNTMKTINDTFTGGNAAQFGREQHGNVVGNAVFAKTQADNAAVANALESGYKTAGDQFNSDASRAATLAGTTGVLAQNDITGRAGLGTTASNITNQGITGGNTAATAAQGLGTATQTAGLTDANALRTSGSDAQRQAQNEETWKYNQWQNKTQDPYNKASWGQGISQGWTLPTQTNNSSNSTTTQTGGSGSPFGQILGGGMGLLGSLGGGSGISSLMGMFGGGGGSSLPGSGTLFAEGGAVTPTVTYAEGGGVDPNQFDMQDASTIMKLLQQLQGTGMGQSILSQVGLGGAGGTGGGMGGLFGGAGAGGMGGMMSSLGPIGAIAAGIGLGKNTEANHAGTPLGDGLLGALAPSGAQILKDPIGMGLPTLLGAPFLAPIFGSDEAKKTKPEWSGLFDLGFAQGGMIPSISAMRKATTPQQPQGTMPTGMPGIPPLPTLAPQLPQGQPNGQPASPFADGGKVIRKQQTRPTLEQQLDAFGKQINASAPAYRGHESPNPFDRDPNPVRQYAYGGYTGGR